MKRIYAIAMVVVASLAGFTASAQTKWTVDTSHSNVKFTVTHMVVSEMEGSFKIFGGTLEHTKEDFSDARISFTIEIASVNTDNERRDGHLKSDDFFNAKDYPQMTFTSTSVKPLGNNKYELKGNLKIRDITKPVVFQVTHGGVLTTTRGAKAGFKATTTINRFDYNLKWDRATETGGLVVSKDVTIQVNVEMNKVMPAAAPGTK